MKTIPSDSAPATVPRSLPGWVAYSALRLALTGVFGAFEFLVLLTELRPVRYLTPIRSAAQPKRAKLGIGPRRKPDFGKKSPSMSAPAALPFYR